MPIKALNNKVDKLTELVFLLSQYPKSKKARKIMEELNKKKEQNIRQHNCQQRKRTKKDNWSETLQKATYGKVIYKKGDLKPGSEEPLD